ncbi:MAG: hypothetical protein HZA50_17270 [Planctomycetes bacterium]|nr:hypothetical protein [Planctomycetota bacterium]
MNRTRLFNFILLGAIALVGGCKPQTVADIFPKGADDLKRADITRATEYDRMAGLIGQEIFDKAMDYNLEAIGRAVYWRNLNDQPDGKAAAFGPAVVVDALQMGTPLDAFGLFSQLQKGRTQADVGAMGVIDGGKILFWKGRFVVRVRPEERLAPGLPSTSPAAGAKKGESGSQADRTAAVAKAVADKIRNDRPKLEYFNWLPAENQVSGSLQYVRRNFLGRSEMEQVMAADYATKDAKYQCFIFGFVSKLSAASVFDKLATGMAKSSAGTDELESLQFFDPKNGEVTLVLAGRMIVGTTQGQKTTALAVAGGFARKFRQRELQEDYYDTYMDAYPYTYYPYSTYYSSFYYSSFYWSPFRYRYNYYPYPYPYPYRYPYRCQPSFHPGGGRHR